VEAAIEAVVLPAIEAHGLTLVDLEVRGNGRRVAVRLYVDKPGGVTISDCQQLSHEVGDLIDVSNLVRSSYDLEVSSPGLDRELRRDRGSSGRPGVSFGSGHGSRWTATASLGPARPGGSAGLGPRHVRWPPERPASLVTKVRLEMEPRGSA
jgi:hypothetical protein